MGTPTRCPHTLDYVDGPADFELDDFLRELAEIGVGGAILGLRRINIERRKLVKEMPTLEPLIDSVLDQVEAIAQPASGLLGAVVSGIGDAIPGERGEQLGEVGRVVATMGPELLKLSGLTRRD